MKKNRPFIKPRLRFYAPIVPQSSYIQLHCSSRVSASKIFSENLYTDSTPYHGRRRRINKMKNGKSRHGSTRQRNKTRIQQSTVSRFVGVTPPPAPPSRSAECNYILLPPSFSPERKYNNIPIYNNNTIIIYAQMYRVSRRIFYAFI